MKTYKVIGGFTVYEQYQINVQAKDSKDASLKINLGVPFKTNERQAQATSERG